MACENIRRANSEAINDGCGLFARTMSNGIISLEDISGNDAEQSGSDSGSDGSTSDELRTACAALGVEYEAVRDRILEQSGMDVESVTEFAQKLADNDELWSAMETYRAFNDQHRIKQNHLLSSEKEFTNWTAAFYGDQDSPDEGTYNFAQQQARDLGGNLYYYKALFPEPDIEHYPSDNAVLWEERPNEDSHIYVPEEFVANYSDYQLEINGQSRPVPPWNGASAVPAESSNGDEPIDPREMTNDEIAGLVGDLDRDQLESLLNVERQTKDRKGAKRHIRDEIDARDSSADADSSADEITVTIDGQEVTGTPEDIRALKGL